MDETATDNLEGRDGEVRFGLAAARREPDEVGQVPLRRVVVGQPFQRQKLERELERTPRIGEVEVIEILR